MFIKHRFLLFAALLFIGLSGNGHAAGQFHAGSGNSSTQIKGTWQSAKSTLTFRADGTIIYKGKRYYYAVSNGGTIQLTGTHGSMTIPYFFNAGKLILMIDGKETVYTRRR